MPGVELFISIRVDADMLNELNPREARKVAQHLLEAADQVEAASQ